VPDDLSQESRLPGLPFGTRGGMVVDHTFPADAEYTIAVELARDLNEGVPLYAEEQLLEVAVDGERVALFTLPAVPVAAPIAANNDPSRPAISQIRSTLRLGGAERAARNRIDADWRVRVPVSAGVHKVTIAFLESTHALDETPRLPFSRPYPAGVNIPETRTGAYLRSFEIAGPYDATAPGDTASRQAIFTCRPASFAADADVPCANDILARLARRAFRRPVTGEDVAPLVAFYRDGRDGRDAAADGALDDERFDAGMRLALKRLLVSPEFLFRVEREPVELAPGATYALDDFALASRLAFFLWSSIPDEALLALAEQGALRQPGGLGRQIERMLADERATAFIEGFAGQWLYLRNLEAAIPVQSKFPDFDDTLRQGLKRETELFVASIVRENSSVLELLRADYTFLNERVARHYGIAGVKGAHFRRVELPADGPRRGLLGHGSILTVTSYPDRTSPVVRGKWILENLLGAAPPPPPPNVPELQATNGAGEALAMRERLAAHRDDPACSGCHALMDPLGFALENFDAIGRFRTIDETGTAIEAGGTLPDGTPFAGVDEFRAALLGSDLYVTTLTEKLMTYALGRGLEHYDMPAVRAIVREAARDDYRFAALVEGVVTSTPFRMRRSGS
jgi:hypothetical protein